MAKTTTSSRSVFTGYISLSMLSVPVKLYAAARTDSTSFNQVHKCSETKITKLNQHMHCSSCNTKVEYAAISKGYEVSKDNFAIVTEEELKALTPQKSDTIEITEFVDLSEVDPIYFEKSYFVSPQDAGRKPYELLYQTMRNTNKAGVAKVVMFGKNRNVFVRAYKNGIMIHQMFADAEVRELVEYNADRSDVNVSDAEVKLTKMLVESMTTTFDKEKLTDDYAQKVEALLATKTANVSGPSTSTVKNDEDLMEKLKASINKAKKVVDIGDKKAA